MDGRSFDRLARLFGATGSRRDALRAVIAGAVLGGIPVASEARKRRRGKASRRKRRAGLSAQAVPASCCSRGNCTPGPGKNLGKCCYEGGDLSGKNFKGANLGGANFSGATLTNANFSGANLGNACFADADLTDAMINRSTNWTGAIFCRTTMPDGSVDDSGCDDGTLCCPTCEGDCPVDPATGEPGFCCPGGICSCDGECCSDCFVNFNFRDAAGNPIPDSEFCCERVCAGDEAMCCDGDDCAPNCPPPPIGGRYRR